MSDDSNTMDSGSDEGELNKVGLWIFVRGELGLLGSVLGRLLSLEEGGDQGEKMSRELFELAVVVIMRL